MSGLPFDVESVSELAHMPSNSCFMLFLMTEVFSMISPVSPLCDSQKRTIFFAPIRRRRRFRRTSGVVPISFRRSLSLSMNKALLGIEVRVS